MGPVEARGRLRTGVGLLEVEAGTAALSASLWTKLAACWVLLVGLVAAQMADAVTTAVALAQPGYLEENSVMRVVTGAGFGATLAVKLGAVLVVVALALWRLPVRRARVALALALGLSLVGPVANTVTLLSL